MQCSKIDAEDLNYKAKAYGNGSKTATALHQKGNLPTQCVKNRPHPPFPRDFVRHPGRPDWGLGQIQSMIGHRITVNFENAGKVLIDGRAIELEPAEPPRP